MTTQPEDGDVVQIADDETALASPYTEDTVQDSDEVEEAPDADR